MGKAAFGERFRECRRSAGLTQQQAAERLGIAIGTVACLEAGKRLPDLNTAMRAAEAFDESLDWLVLGRGKGRVPARHPRRSP